MSARTLYERVIAEAARLAAPKPKVRASSAVVPWRRAPDGELEVFWVERAAGMRFMGGWHAFPGGGVCRADAAEAEELPVAGRPRGLSAERTSGALPETLVAGLGRLAPDDVPGLVGATLRELFEETGLLPTVGPPPPPERLAAARRALLAKESSFAEVVGDLGAELDASPLVFAGRWLTPPFAPVRFDNRFFLFEHPSGGPELVADTSEAAHGEWVRPAAALERWRRGEVIAAPPILHLLRVLAEDGPEAGLERLREPADANLGPFRHIEFRPGIVMLPLAGPTLPPASHTNAYLVGTGDAVLVDPGTPFGDETERLVAALEAVPERLGRRLTAIWLTHHHRDHVGAVEAVRSAFGVPVLAHPLTAERLASGRGLAVEGVLEDGARVELAGPPGGDPLVLDVHHTPGHAPGHLAFFEPASGSLLAGDLVSAVSTIVVDPPEGDMDAYLASLERMAELRPTTLFPGHGGAIVPGEAKLRAFLEHRLAREEKILAAWRDGARTPQAMLPTVYDDAPRQAWPLAERQIEAHLVRLRRAGRLGA